jgi:diacylglycerol O-acyltransferase
MEILSTRERNGTVPSANRLSAADAAFLYLERKEIPLHIACVFIFDGPIPFRDFVSSIESRLHLIPRYRQVVVMPEYNLDQPAWEDDAHFDIRRHIFRVSLDPPGGDAELENLAGRIFGQLMDRSKPLWDIHVVDGLKDGRGALILRAHHSLADGVSGVALVSAMLDTNPEGPGTVKKPHFRPRKAPAQNYSLMDALSTAVRDSVEGLIAAETGLLGWAQALLGDPALLQRFVGLMPELAASVERLPCNKPCTGGRKFCWAEFDLKDVDAIRAVGGGTINDVVLTLLTRSLARYVKLHRQSVVNRFVRIVCPVSLRHGEQNGDLGNQLSFMPVALPLGVRDPVELLKAVAARTDTIKRGRAADLVVLAANWIASAPPALQALLWWSLGQLILPVPLFNMICTNIPGSPVPLYALGRRLIAAYPQVPTGYELGINCAVHSYDGKLFFGLIADAHAAPDVGRLRDYLYVSFRELCRATGVKKAARRARPHKQAVTPAQPVPEEVSERAPSAPAGTEPPLVMDTKAVA